MDLLDVRSGAGEDLRHVKDIGIDQSAGACREYQSAARCVIAELSSLHVEKLQRFVPVPWDERSSVMVQFLLCGDIRKIRSKVRNLLFFASGIVF